MDIPKLDGYKEPLKLKYNFIILSIVGIFLQIFSLIFFSIIRFWIEKGYIPNEISGSFGLGTFIWSIIWFVTLFVLTISLHEFVHGTVFKYFGYKIRYGLKLPYAAYAIAEKQFIKKFDQIVVALAPLFILDAICLLVFFVKFAVFSNIALFVLIINTSGAIGDLWVVFKSLPYPKNTLFYDYSAEENYVYIPK